MKKKTTKEKPINQTLTAINSHLASIDKRFGTIDKRFDTMDKQFDTVDKRFHSIKTNMATKNNIRRLSLQIVENTDGIKKLQETKVDKSDLDYFQTVTDSYAKNFKSLNQEPYLNRNRINQMEGKLENHDTRLANIENKPPSTT